MRGVAGEKPPTLSNAKTKPFKSKTIGSKVGNNNTANRKFITRKIVRKALRNKKKPTSSTNLKRSNSSAVNATIAKTKKVKNPTTNKNKQKQKQKQKQKLLELDEASRLQRRTRYLLIKMKLEQNLIDAYSGDGWKGQSREKIKPEKELQRAKKQILKCKLGLRDAIHQLESLSAVGSIENSFIAPDGSVHHDQIFCAKCKLREAFPDNDIVLCDGTCNRAFHQKCLDPPLYTENIPPDDQGWFCKFCEHKMEVLDSMNAHLGTYFTADTRWQDIFREEADGGNSVLNQEEDWPSDDSADVDYNPDKNQNNNSITDDDDNASDGTSGSTSLSWSSDAIMFSGYENLSLNRSAESGETSEGEIIHGRRQRRAVDYNKLYDEMFGKDGIALEQISEDEDWGPAKKKRKEKESDAVSTHMTHFENKKQQDPNIANHQVKNNVPDDQKTKKSFSRIPPHAVEKLRQVFAENELPSRTVKENLSKELDIQPEKISKWFKNARYMALKIRKAEGAEEPPGSTTRIPEDSDSEPLKKSIGNAVPLVGKTNAQSKDLSLFKSAFKKKRRVKPLSADSDKVATKSNEDVSLNKVNAKLKEKEKVNVIEEGEGEGSESREAEAAMERLCRTKDRLLNLQERLSRVVTSTTKKPRRKNLEDVVMYVPIAELREKP